MRNMIAAFDRAATRRTWRGCGRRPASAPGRRARRRSAVVSCGSTSTPRSASPTELEQNAAATWKKTFGPPAAGLFGPAGGRGRGGAGRPAAAGNAGSNTATDHVTVLTMALAQLPEHARPRPGDPGSPRVLARSDSAGAAHLFAAACRKEGPKASAACAPPSPDQPLPSSHHHRPAPACPPAATMPAPGHHPRSRHRQDADRSGPQPPANTKSRSNQAGCGRFRSRVKEGG